MCLLIGVSFVAGCLAFCSQLNVAVGASSTVAQTRGFPFKAIADDALVLKTLLVVENLIVADGASAIPAARPLAHHIEQRDDRMQRLFTDVIHDAAIVARARQEHAPRADRTSHSTAVGGIFGQETIEVRTKIDHIEGLYGGWATDSSAMLELMRREQSRLTDVVGLQRKLIRDISDNLKGVVQKIG